MKFVAGFLLFVLGACSAWAADSSESPESFHVELTGSAWLVNSGGAIQASGSPINLVTDLGVYQQQPTFFGRRVNIRTTSANPSGVDALLRGPIFSLQWKR